MTVNLGLSLQQRFQDVETTLQRATNYLATQQFPFALRYGQDACVAIECVEPSNHTLPSKEKRAYAALRRRAHRIYMDILVSRAEQILADHHATSSHFEEAQRRLASARHYAMVEHFPVKRQIDGLLRLLAEAQKTLKIPLEITP